MTSPTTQPFSPTFASTRSSRAFGLLLATCALAACAGRIEDPNETSGDGAFRVVSDGGSIMHHPDAGLHTQDAATLAPSDRDAAPDTSPTTNPGDDAGPGVPLPSSIWPIVPNQGGRVLANVALVTVTYSDDAARAATLTAFGRWMVSSSWLTMTGRDYGVGAGTVAGEVALTESAPDRITDSEIESMLVARINAGVLPRPTSDSLYMVYFPSHTTITENDGTTTSTSCVDFGAYHYEVHHGGLDFAYAAVAECPEFDPGGTTIESVEIGASHELIEAVTDPFPGTAPTFSLPDPTDEASLRSASSWLALGGEVGDLCAALPMPYREGEFVATRVWSNSAARAGQDPCIPSVAGAPFYNTVASPGTIQFVRAGESVSIALDGYGAAGIARWDLQTETEGDFTPTATLSADNLGPGESATVTVSVPAGTPSQSIAQIYVYSVHSDTDYALWPVMVYVP